MTDPLGLVRCQSCGNAFEVDEQPDGTCRHCGGPFRRRGRPVAGAPVKTRLPADLLARLDVWAATRNMSRAEAIRTLLAEALS